MFKDKKILIGLIVFFLIIFPLTIFWYNQKEIILQEKPLESPEKEQVDLGIDLEKLKGHIELLSSEDFQGRRAGTIGEAETVLYLAQELKKYGIKPWGNNNTYFQTFPLPLTDLHQVGKRAEFYIKDYGTKESSLVADNVLGIINSKNNPDEYILLSAHLDHLGVWREQIYPGANDNASGVGAVLEIARVLQSHSDILPFSVIIAFWSGEEMGLIGSRFFSNNPLVDLDSIKMVINLDSIGLGSENDFILWQEQNSEVIKELLTRLTEDGELKMIEEDSGRHSSDHKPFADSGIPAVTLLAKDWLTDNHTPQDTLINLNLKKIGLLAEKIIDFLIRPQIQQNINP